MSEKIRVLLVDDHEMVRMGLKTYLDMQTDIEVVGEANNGEAGINQALSLRPDVVLMDLVMDGIDGIEATKQIMLQKDVEHELKIIVLTSYLDDEKVFPVIEAGAFSYLLKTSSASDIANSIRQAYKGVPILEGKVTSMMMNKMQLRPKHLELTKRELEVLKLIGEGYSNQDIAESLHIGIKTVKTHVSHIFAKLEVEDRTQAAIYANKQGLST